MLADLERTLRRRKLEQAAALLKDTVLPVLPDNVLWDTLTFCPLRDTAQMAAVNRCWRRVAEARLLAALRVCKSTVKTRWVSTEWGFTPEPTQHIRADIHVAFDFERNVGPVVVARADLLCHAFVDNVVGDRDALYEPSRPWTVRRRNGFRVVQQSAGHDEAASPQGFDRDAPRDSDAKHAKQRFTRFAARLPLSKQRNDGVLRLTLPAVGAPLVLDDHVRHKQRNAAVVSVDVDLLPTHARVSVNGEWALDSFGDDAEQAWRPLRGVLDELAPPQILLRTSTGVRGAWRWATDPRPGAHLPGTRALRIAMAQDRAHEIEGALADAGLRWKTIAQLRAVDFFCKDALRVDKPGNDFVAKQLGFVAHRHRYALAPELLVSTIRRCERRFEHLCDVAKRHLSPWPVDHWGLTAKLKELTKCKIEREILTSLVWAARFGLECDPLTAPPRPENAGVYEHLDDGVNSELLRPLTADQRQRYLSDLHEARGRAVQSGGLHGYVTHSAY